MTVTFRSAHRASPPWRQFVVRASAAMVTVALLCTAAPALADTPAAAPAAMWAAAPAPTPSTAPASEAGMVSVILSPVNQGVLTAGAPLSVSVTIDNGSVLALAPATVTLALSPQPLADRAALTRWLDGDGALEVAVQDIATAATEPVAINDATTLGVMLAADDPALIDRTPGVYALRAIYASSTGSVEATSAVVVPDPAQATAQVGIVVPITAPPISAGLLTSEQLGELTSPQGSLTAQAEALAGTSAILAIDPAIVAAIRVLGTSAPESATAWLTAVTALPNSRFGLQFGDADVTAQMDAGLPQPLQPLSLESYMSPESFIPLGPSAAPTPDPTTTTSESGTPQTPGPPSTPGTPSMSPGATTGATPAPTDPVFPDLAALQGLGGAARGSVFWPADGIAGPAAVEALASATASPAASPNAEPALTLVASTSTESGATGATVTARGATEAGSGLLVYDARISAALRDASQTNVGALRGAHLTEATALLSFAAVDAAGVPLLVTLDRADASADARTRVGIGTAISAIDDAPAIEMVPLDGLVNASPQAVTIVDAAANEARVGMVAPLVDDEARLTAFSSILDTPQVLTGPERAAMLHLLGVAWNAIPAEWAETFAAHREATNNTLDAVRIQPPSSIQLISPGADLRFWVTNDLDYPVNVTLLSEPNNLRLEVQDRTDLPATARSNTPVNLPVEARVGNGDVTLTLQLISPTGVAIGDRRSAEVTVRADWEAIGLTIMAVLVAGLLVIGVARTLLRRRKTRGAASGDAADGDAADNDDADNDNADKDEVGTEKVDAERDADAEPGDRGSNE